MQSLLLSSLTFAAAYKVQINKRPSQMVSHYLGQRAHNKTEEVPTEHLATGQSMYTGSIMIDGKDFTVDFDTGSATLVLPASNFHGQVDGNKTKKVCKSSDKPLEIQYGSGATIGCEATGEFGILDFKVADYKYLAYNQFESQGGGAFNLCGMGWQSLDSTDTNQKPFIQMLYEQKSIPEPMFSFSLASLGTSGESELFIGELDDSAAQGEIAWIPTATAEEGNTPGYWMINQKFIFPNGEMAENVATVVDSGTTMIALQQELYEAVLQSFQIVMENNNYACGDLGQQITFCGREVPGGCHRNQQKCMDFEDERGHKVGINQDQFDDNVLQQVVFSVGVTTVDQKQVQLDLTVGDLFFDQQGIKILGVQQVPQGIEFNLFGDVFMSQVYTVFSYNRGASDHSKSHPAIGFGQKGGNGSNIAKGGNGNITTSSTTSHSPLLV
jgi:hypothetical protein